MCISADCEHPCRANLFWLSIARSSWQLNPIEALSVKHKLSRLAPAREASDCNMPQAVELCRQS